MLKICAGVFTGAYKQGEEIVSEDVLFRKYLGKSRSKAAADCRNRAKDTKKWIYIYISSKRFESYVSKGCQQRDLCKLY